MSRPASNPVEAWPDEALTLAAGALQAEYPKKTRIWQHFHGVYIEAALEWPGVLVIRRRGTGEELVRSLPGMPFVRDRCPVPAAPVIARHGLAAAVHAAWNESDALQAKWEAYHGAAVAALVSGVQGSRVLEVLSRAFDASSAATGHEARARSLLVGMLRSAGVPFSLDADPVIPADAED